MTDSGLAEKRVGLTPAQKALLEKRLKGKPTTAERPSRPQELIVDINQQLSPYPLRAFQRRGLQAAQSSGQLPWFFLESETAELNGDRFADCMATLIERHGALRTTLISEERSSSTQEPLARAGSAFWRPVCWDLREHSEAETEHALAEIRATFRHPQQGLEQPALSIELVRLGEQRWRLFLGVNLLLLDLLSIEFLALQCRQLYEGRRALHDMASYSFRDYVMTELAFQSDSPAFSKARDYWAQRLPGLPAPLNAGDFPGGETASGLEPGAYHYQLEQLPASRWKALKQWAANQKLTGSMVVYALYRLSLAAFSRRRDFSLEVRLFNRIGFDQRVNDVPGQYSVGLLNWIDADSASDLLEYCRRTEAQTWRDLDHGYFDVASHRQLEGPANPPTVVFTSTISRYEEFVEEGAVPPMKWFGTSVETLACTPQQTLELLIVENAGELELHWFCNHTVIPPRISAGIIEQVQASLLRFATDPAQISHTKLDELTTEPEDVR